MNLEQLATIRELMEKTGKSESEAVSFLKKLGVPMIDGTFSERLLMTRLETIQNPEPAPAPSSSTSLHEHLARLGFVVRRVLSQRPMKLELGVTRPMLIGSPEFSTESVDDPWTRLRVEPGQTLVALAQVANKRGLKGSRTADFNIQFERRRGAGQADLHILYLVSEDQCWILKPGELDAMRVSLDDSRSHYSPDQSFWFFPVDAEGHVWRLAIGRGRCDFEAQLRVEPTETRSAGWRVGSGSSKRRKAP